MASRTIIILSSVLLLSLVASVFSHATCTSVLANDPSSFTDGSQHSDCDYEVPDQIAPADAAQHAIDLHWIQMAHDYAIANMPSLPFGALLVDNRTNTLVSIGTNMFNSDHPIFSHQVVSHAETVVITNATINSLPDTWTASTQKRKPHPDWKFMTLYGNIEACPMCSQGAIWRGLRKMVFGARASALQSQRCWTQPTLTTYEVVDHSAHFAPFTVVRGPMSELEDTIVKGFSQSCKAATAAPATPFTCSASYTINSEWSTGLTGSVSVSVSDATLLKVDGAAGWSISFSTKGNGVAAPFQITSSWDNGGVSSSTVGTKTTYTVKNASYNSQSPSFGFVASTTVSSPFNNICGLSINGVSCSVSTPTTTSASC
jgi:tRNA(Arg) A34 adenosine deaminase TadA